MGIKKIIVLFKTHLDIGFTDFSANITKKYLNELIPNSIRVAKELREGKGNSRLIWTTGSWLINEYLKIHKGEEGNDLREAIKNGEICWHGLPFTTHTELMGVELFKYGLSISQKLDKEFGKKTIAAKLTDVPGHTKAMIPYLRKAGIEFLHIGVNPGSAVPSVPPIFKWQADNGDSITVMYHNTYGEFSEIGDSGVAIYFAHTGDNAGVQSQEQIKEIFAEIKEKYPNTEVVAGNLNDVAMAVREIENNLPIVTDEIGDTWIHGVGTDPFKVSAFRNLQKFWAELPDGEDKEILGSGLLLIPEHTWGLNVNIHLADHEIYERDNFNEYRKSADNFLKMEKSWQEQRNYIFNSVNCLSKTNREKALAIIAESKRNIEKKSYAYEILCDTEVELKGYKIVFGSQGEIISLKKGGMIFADKKHRLCSLIYEQFCEDDYKRFFTQYNRSEKLWVYEDFTKPGMKNGSSYYCRFEPNKVSIYPSGDRLLVRYFFADEAHKKFGCPLTFDMIIDADDDSLYFDLAWFNKPANRVAEAIWFGFRPIATNKRISKFGKGIDPKKVVNNGQCRLHATDYGVIYNELSIESVDTALVAPQFPSLLNFNNDKPNDSDGVYFNLYNNVWGTNFPMWYDEDARFRFNLKIK